ncbi:MAG: hypothetical protein V4596_05230 [Bdellovibrionota bacterium]
MENTVLKLESDGRKNLINQLYAQIDIVAVLGSLQNITIRTTSEEGIKKIDSLDSESLVTRITDLKKHIIGMQNAILGKGRVSNQEMTKNILEFMKYRTNTDIIDSISEDDIVEIYNLDCIQIFRNFKFYETTTYSLSDLISFDWSELYYRPSQVSQKIQKHITAVLQNSDDSITYDMSDVPTHMIKEIKASPIQLCEIRFKKIAPITNNIGKRTGLIVTCEAKSMLSDLSHEGIDFI